MNKKTYRTEDVQMSQNQQCLVWHVVEQCNNQCDALPTYGMYNINQVEIVKPQDLEDP